MLVRRRPHANMLPCARTAPLRLAALLTCVFVFAVAACAGRVTHTVLLPQHDTSARGGAADGNGPDAAVPVRFATELDPINIPDSIISASFSAVYPASTAELGRSRRSSASSFDAYLDGTVDTSSLAGMWGRFVLRRPGGASDTGRVPSPDYPAAAELYALVTRIFGPSVFTEAEFTALLNMEGAGTDGVDTPADTPVALFFSSPSPPRTKPALLPLPCVAARVQRDTLRSVHVRLSRTQSRVLSVLAPVHIDTACLESRETSDAPLKVVHLVQAVCPRAQGIKALEAFAWLDPHVGMHPTMHVRVATRGAVPQGSATASSAAIQPVRALDHAGKPLLALVVPASTHYFVDPFQVSAPARAMRPQMRVAGVVDLENPQGHPSSNPHFAGAGIAFVATNSDDDGRGADSHSAVEVPLHMRYHRPTENISNDDNASTHARVKLHSPVILGHACSDAVSSDVAAWGVVAHWAECVPRSVRSMLPRLSRDSSNATSAVVMVPVRVVGGTPSAANHSLVADLTVLVPVGDRTRLQFVAFVTMGVTVAMTCFIVWAAVTQGMNVADRTQVKVVAGQGKWRVSEDVVKPVGKERERQEVRLRPGAGKSATSSRSRSRGRSTSGVPGVAGTTKGKKGSRSRSRSRSASIRSTQ